MCVRVLYCPIPRSLQVFATRELCENEKRLVKLEILEIRRNINRRKYNTYPARTMEDRGSLPLVMTVHRPLYIARISLKNTLRPPLAPLPLFKASHFVFALYFRIYVYAFYRSRFLGSLLDLLLNRRRFRTSPLGGHKKPKSQVWWNVFIRRMGERELEKRRLRYIERIFLKISNFSSSISQAISRENSRVYVWNGGYTCSIRNISINGDSWTVL